MNEYLKIRWLHEDPAYPVLLLSELDQDRREVRKIEVYADGRCEFAAAEGRTGSAELGDVPVPAVEEIAADPHFVVEDTSAADFERLWATSGLALVESGKD